MGTTYDTSNYTNSGLIGRLRFWRDPL